MSELTYQELLNVLNEMRANAPQEDEGWYTFRELQAKWKVSKNRTNLAIDEFLAAGLMEAGWAVKQSRVPGLSVRRVCYRVKR